MRPAIFPRRGPAPAPRRTARARRRVRRILEGVLAFMFIAAIVVAFSQYVDASPRFHVQNFKVYGEKLVPDTKIVAVTGLTTADGMLSFDPEVIAARVEEIPYIAKCTVKRGYPDFVNIYVEERVPVATLLIDSHAFEIDMDGVVLQERDPLAPPTGPLITGVPDLGYVEIAQDLDHPALSSALQLWEEFQSIPIAKELTLSELHAASDDELTMYFNELPFALRWGRGDYRLQALRLEFFRRKLGELPPCTEVLDLRFENNIVCR